MVVLVGDSLSDPLVPRVPDQPPLDVHELALVLDQVRVELAPEVIDVGLAVNDTEGAGAGGGDGGGEGGGVLSGTTVIEVGWHGDVLPAESVAQTLKSYRPGTMGVPVRSPLGLRIMPSGGAPSVKVAV